MPERHAPKTLMLGRVRCACGWTYTLGPDFQGRPKVRRYDALLDEWLEHEARMKRRGL